MIHIKSGRTGSVEEKVLKRIAFHCGEALDLAMGPPRVFLLEFFSNKLPNMVNRIKKIRKDFRLKFSQDHRNFIYLCKICICKRKDFTNCETNRWFEHQFFGWEIKIDVRFSTKLKFFEFRPFHLKHAKCNAFNA